MSFAERANFPRQELLQTKSLIDQAVNNMISSGQTVLGPGVFGFEERFAEWLRQDLSQSHCIGVGNGTDAIELALRCAGVNQGDRVLLPSLTAYATAAAVLRLGAEPVFGDVIEGSSSTLSPRHVEALLSRSDPPIKALVAVHLYGESCELESLQELCRRHGVVLIEDCAQATGTVYQGNRVGTFGDFSAFSFYPTKNLAACGDGGMLVVKPEASDEQLASARRLRFYGWNNDREAVQFGVNSRLDELQAWILSGKLKSLDWQISERRRIASLYHDQLKDLEADELIVLPKDGSDWLHSYHLFVIQVDSRRREGLLHAGAQQGIPLGVHYAKACHQHPFIISQYGLTPNLRNTEERVSKILTLPINPYLADADIEIVCDFLRRSLAVVAPA